MPHSAWATSLEVEQGVLASLSHWISSLFKMLAISLNPKPPHIQSPDSDSSSNDASNSAESVTSFTTTTTTSISTSTTTTSAPPPSAPSATALPTAPPSAFTRSTSLSSSPSLPQQQSQPLPDMFVKPAVPGPISSSPSHGPSNITKRPKLSLQTSSLPITFGKSTTSLSLALSAGCSSSPTVRNTFSNAYDGFRQTASLSPVGASSPKGGPRPGKRGSSYLCNYQGVDDQIPYKLPLGLRSVLRNSPFRSSSLRRPSSLAAQSGNGSSNGHSGRKVLFPAKRQVKYRYPLDEEIKTVRYVAKHSDLLTLDSETEPSDGNTSSDDEGEESDYSSQSPPSSNLSEDDETAAPPEEVNRNNANGDASDDVVVVKNSNSAPATTKQRPRSAKRKHSTSERQIRAVALREDLAGSSSTFACLDNTPRTPLLHQRRKRPCKWRWTLGPVENEPAQHITNTTSLSSNLNPDDATTTTVPSSNQEATPTPTTPAPGPSPVVLRCPSPKRRPMPLETQGGGQDPMCDILHEASSIPLPESLRSSPTPP
ncbi:hypothetical protein AJ78_03436 [Emergomyces pasteurianus Ep9510]|uniref:Uncharacterized protein n=1 Tax=Emergomyces pasteurianus Ep9510 TaxID=1447872 RepID=A0A1J9PK27_9EURO|nr:hypothetical protein AJ78_03436 [Emergomyces pasteurianus Ep9510]